MNDVEQFVASNINNCIQYDNFRFNIYCYSNHIVFNTFISEYFNKLCQSLILRRHLSYYEDNIMFRNGSTIRLLYPNDCVRGIKCNSIMISNLTPDDIKECVLIPCLIDYSIDQIRLIKSSYITFIE